MIQHTLLSLHLPTLFDCSGNEHDNIEFQMLLLLQSGCLGKRSKQFVCIQDTQWLDLGARELHAFLHKQCTLALHLGCVQSLQARIATLRKIRM